MKIGPANGGLAHFHEHIVDAHDRFGHIAEPKAGGCLLYTSDAADERSSVDLGGRRIIKKKKREKIRGGGATTNKPQKSRGYDRRS